MPAMAQLYIFALTPISILYSQMRVLREKQKQIEKRVTISNENQFEVHMTLVLFSSHNMIPAIAIVHQLSTMCFKLILTCG